MPFMAEKIARLEKENNRVLKVGREKSCKIVLLKNNIKNLNNMKSQVIKKYTRSRKRAATDKTAGYTVENPVIGPPITNVMNDISQRQT